MLTSDRRLLGDHVVIAIQTGEGLMNIEPAIPMAALTHYSPLATALFNQANHSFVLPIANVEAEDVIEAIAWIIKTCETGKPAKIYYIQYNPITTHFRKLELARKLGIQQL
jgi:hypothetical protein